MSKVPNFLKYCPGILTKLAISSVKIGIMFHFYVLSFFKKGDNVNLLFKEIRYADFLSQKIKEFGHKCQKGVGRCRECGYLWP